MDNCNYPAKAIFDMINDNAIDKEICWWMIITNVPYIYYGIIIADWKVDDTNLIYCNWITYYLVNQPLWLIKQF